MPLWCTADVELDPTKTLESGMVRIMPVCCFHSRGSHAVIFTGGLTAVFPDRIKPPNTGKRDECINHFTTQSYVIIFSLNLPLISLSYISPVITSLVFYFLCNYKCDKL